MTPRLVRVVVAAVLIAVAWTVVSHLRGDARRIRRELAALVEAVESSTDTNQLAAAAAARRAADHFTADLSLWVEPYEGRLTDRQALAGAVLRLGSLAREVAIEVSRFEVEVRRDNRTAESSFVAAVTLDLGDRRAGETWLVRARWREEGSRWLIHELELVEPAERGSRLPF